jgi:hypothetical protein
MTSSLFCDTELSSETSCTDERCTFGWNNDDSSTVRVPHTLKLVSPVIYLISMRASFTSSSRKGEERNELRLVAAGTACFSAVVVAGQSISYRITECTTKLQDESQNVLPTSFIRTKYSGSTCLLPSPMRCHGLRHEGDYILFK